MGIVGQVKPGHQVRNGLQQGPGFAYHGGMTGMSGPCGVGQHVADVGVTPSGYRENASQRGARIYKTARLEGFTLIELPVVAAIIAILASLVMASVSKRVERGKMAKCTSNVRQMALALTLYVDDQGYYPPDL